MKNDQIKLPRGYTKLLLGEVIQTNDRFFSLGFWHLTACAGKRVGDPGTVRPPLYARCNKATK